MTIFRFEFPLWYRHTIETIFSWQPRCLLSPERPLRFNHSLTSLHNRRPHTRQDYYIETWLLCPQLFAAWSHTGFIFCSVVLLLGTQIAKFMGPTWGPPGSCRPQLGPMLAPWTLLSGYCLVSFISFRITSPSMISPLSVKQHLKMWVNVLHGFLIIWN